MNTQHGHGTTTNNILFLTHNHNRHENPVRDNNVSQTLLFKKDEHEYKDYYGVSNFKFPEITPKVLSTNHANFCELSFDGTKSTKHHHRRNNTIKRVTSATMLNCSVKKDVESTCQHEPVLEEKSNKDTAITYHNLAEQFKRKLKFIETPVKLGKSKLCNNNQTGSTFEVILSPKKPTSFTSIDTMQSSDHRHNKIIVTQMNKPDMRDREIQTAIIGIRNLNCMDEYINMRLPSVNDIFYNMDILSSNEDLFSWKRKKRKKLNLTMTNFPCVEIKCSSLSFEMPTNAQRPQMPRRTLNTDNSIIEDFHEEPVTVNSSEATDNFKDKLFNLFNDTQVTTSDDYNKKVNDLCGLIGNLLLENKNKCENNVKKSIKIPGEMFINITKLKTGDANTNTNDTLIIPSYTTPKNNMYQRSSNSSPNRSNHTISQNRSRSLSPPNRPSTPSCQISKIKIPEAESNNQMFKINESRTKSDSKLCSNTTPNLTAGIQNQKFSYISIPSVSTISNGSHNIRMVFDDSEDNIKPTPQVGTRVPRNVFIIPPHVNEILKNCEHNDTNMNTTIKEIDDCQKAAFAKKFNNNKSSDFHLMNILKKPPVRQSWVVPDFVNKSQLKCDTVNHFQCTRNKIPKKNEHECGGPSVTFSSMVDVFGDSESLIEGKCSTPHSRNTIVPITALKISKTYPNKTEVHTANDRGETSCENNKAKLHNEKQASFYNSSFLSTKREVITTSCLQKRKEYDNKLKMQNKQDSSKIPLFTKGNEQGNSPIKNESFKMNKSKLPLKILNKNDTTTDMKVNTPRPTSFIQKSSRNHVENTKDVAIQTKKKKLYS